MGGDLVDQVLCQQEDQSSDPHHPLKKKKKANLLSVIPAAGGQKQADFWSTLASVVQPKDPVHGSLASRRRLYQPSHNLRSLSKAVMISWYLYCEELGCLCVKSCLLYAAW